MAGQVEVNISQKWMDVLVKTSVVTGRSVESLIDEALEQFCLCNASVLIESVAERAATA